MQTLTKKEQAILNAKGTPQEIADALNYPIKEVYDYQRKLRALGYLPGDEERREVLLRWFQTHNGCVKEAAVSLGWDYMRTCWLANGLVRERKLTDKIFQKGSKSKYPGLADGIIRLSKEGLYTPKEFYEALDHAFPLCAVKSCVNYLRARRRIPTRPRRMEIDDALIRLSEEGMKTSEEFHEALNRIVPLSTVKKRLTKLRKKGRIPKGHSGGRPKYNLDDEIIRLCKERRVTAKIISSTFGVSPGWAEKRIATLRKEGRIPALQDCVIEYLKLNPQKSCRKAAAEFGVSIRYLSDYRTKNRVAPEEVYAAIDASDKTGRELVEELAEQFQCSQEVVLRAARKLDLKTYCRLIEATAEEEDAVLAQAEQTLMDVDVARLAPLANLERGRIADIRRVVAWKNGCNNVAEFFHDYAEDVYAERNLCDPPQEYVEAMADGGYAGAQMPQETFDRYYELFRQKEIRSRAGKSTIVLKSRRNNVSV